MIFAPLTFVSGILLTMNPVWHVRCFHKHKFGLRVLIRQKANRRIPHEFHSSKVDLAMTGNFYMEMFFTGSHRLTALVLCFLSVSVFSGCGEGETGGGSATADKPKPAAAEEPLEESSGESSSSTPAEPVAADPVEEKKAAASPTPAPAARKVVDPSATGSFSGTIVLDGDVPDLKPLAKKGDENLKDKEVCGAADIPDDSLLVGDGNGIANVFVYLRRAPKGFKSEPPTEPVVLDQKGCIFTPHVALIQAGQKVLVKSSDAVQHNVHTFPARNQSTNLLVNPNEQTGIELTYLKAESEPLQVKCDIHAWMSSYHLVLDHPFMAVTDANGKFSVEGLPAGEYEFRVWHEKGGLLERGYKFTVTGEDEAVALKYSSDKFSG